MCNKMSDVRLSNASPTLERVDARQADSFRPSVRRNLFGTPDQEEIRRYVRATLQEEVRGFREAYNFDPVEERPLGPGNYEWEVDSDPPEFYLRAPHGNRGEAAGDTRQRSAGESDRQPDRNGSRKRRSDGSGSCSSDCQSKILHTDEDDDEDESHGAGSVCERKPSRPQSGAEAH